MTLKIAVSEILSKNITDEEAKEFAFKEFGVLCAYIRNEAFKKVLIDKIGERKYKIISNKIINIELSNSASTERNKKSHERLDEEYSIE